MRHEDLTRLSIHKAVNGYIVETADLMKGAGVPSQTTFVFQSLTALHEWLAENFAV